MSFCGHVNGSMGNYAMHVEVHKPPDTCIDNTIYPAILIYDQLSLLCPGVNGPAELYGEL